MHIPLVHDGMSLLVLQTLPQAPQLFGSLPIEVSQFVPGCPGQCANPMLQLPMAHMPLAQAGDPFIVVQVRPHIPQLAGVVCVLVSQPSLGSLLQSPNPFAHAVITHCPAVQVSVALLIEHCFLHAPQLFGSPSMWTSQPVAGLLSQSA
jgi:hypothetical protein